MQLLVRRPFHSPLGLGELVDQFQQPLVFDQFGLGRERFLRFRIDIFLERIRLGLKHEQIAQIADQIRHQPHHVFASFALLVKNIERGCGRAAENFTH